MNAFNLHDQLNVLVQKLAAGAIRKVRMAAGALLGAYAVWKQRGDTYFFFPVIAAVLCAEHPGKLICPDSG